MSTRDLVFAKPVMNAARLGVDPGQLDRRLIIRRLSDIRAWPNRMYEYTFRPAVRA
jgi:hypothetical protein